MASAADASMIRLLRMDASAASGSESTLSASSPAAAASAGVSRQRLAAASASINANSASLARSNWQYGELRERPRTSGRKIIGRLLRAVTAVAGEATGKIEKERM